MGEMLRVGRISLVRISLEFQAPNLEICEREKPWEFYKGNSGRIGNLLI